MAAAAARQPLPRPVRRERAAGLEALSRGARGCCLIDQASAAVAASERNIQTLGEARPGHVLRDDACRLRPAPHPFDIVFVDPPYGSGLLAPALASLGPADGWRRALESWSRWPPASRGHEIVGFDVEDERTYGAARLIFLRQGGTDGEAVGPSGLVAGLQRSGSQLVDGLERIFFTGDLQVSQLLLGLQPIIQLDALGPARGFPQLVGPLLDRPAQFLVHRHPSGMGTAVAAHGACTVPSTAAGRY